MKLHALLCSLALAGCATVPSTRSSAVEPVACEGAAVVDPEAQREPVRMETPAGTFLVHPNNAEDFAKLLAGESTKNQYISVTDAP